MSRHRAALWAASLAAIHGAAASVLPLTELFTRQSSCATNFSQCKNANFPDYFCCPSGQNCIALAGNTTLLCCPHGSDCQRIRPLPCDLSLQDGQRNPDAVVKTTALGGTLGRCGNRCCPFGYSCSRNTECVMAQNQNPVPIQTSTPRPSPTSTASAGASTSTGAATSPTADASSPAATPAASSSTTSGSTGSSSGPPVAAIAGGVLAAIILVGAAVLAFAFLRKKKAAGFGSPPKPSRSTSSFGNLISNPIVGENLTIRSDFVRVPALRKPAKEPGSVTGHLLGPSLASPEAAGMLATPPAAAVKPERQSSVAYGYGGPESPPFVAMSYVDYDSGLLPQTPLQQREPSSVSINVFADPNITPDRTPESNTDRRYTNMTTFTQMLDTADLGGIARGEAYVPYRPTGEGASFPRQ